MPGRPSQCNNPSGRAVDRAMSDSTEDLEQFDPHVYALVGRFLRAFTTSYFRFKLHGLEKLPEGPCLIVGNHSGLGVADVMCMLGAWYDAFGLERRGTGMMAYSFIEAPLVGRLFRAFGAVPASPENARAALRAGHDVLVYPGGELDACRPFYQPRTVVFGPRRGYVRLALDLGVPVVPLATIGSHWTMPMLPGGELVSRLLNTRRWLRNDRFPLPVGAVAAVAGTGMGIIPLWATGFLFLMGLVPLPARITSRLLPPIDLAAATAGVGNDADRVERAHRLVHGALQRAVQGLRHDEPERFPEPSTSRVSARIAVPPGVPSLPVIIPARREATLTAHEIPA